MRQPSVISLLTARDLPLSAPSSPPDRTLLGGTLAASMERMVRMATDACGAECGVIALLGNDRRCFQSGSNALPWMAHDCGAIVRSGILSLTIENDGSLFVRDARHVTEQDPMRSAARELDIVAMASSAMTRSDGTVLGVLAVFSTEPREWSSVHERMLRDMADMAATEIQLRRALADRETRERQLQHDSLHDALTGLPNRTLFMRRLTDASMRAKRGDDGLFAVLFLDLDDFKTVNDRFGHRAGDEILVSAARRLEDCVRGGDLVARLGGDEFAILLERVADARDSALVAERVQAALGEPFTVGGCGYRATASIGVVLSSSGCAQPESMLRNADMAMYRAKNSGRARFEMFDRAMHEDALARLQLEQDLRRALDREDFQLHYQPIVTLSTGELAGVEALVRWKVAEGKLLAPGEFIPVAEETGLIVPLGRWVLREACQQVCRWRAEFGVPTLRLSVNLSVREFAQPDLTSAVAVILRETGLDPRALQLEITESAIIGHGHPALHTIAELRTLGVAIHLDDFGTGYSALSYLHRLPLDAVKVDRATTSVIDAEERPLQVVRSIVGLVHALGMDVVAEGITTSEQLALLRHMGCDLGQGYYFSVPRPAEELTDLISSARKW
ncbi:MAG: EAL domain-containing protein [Gemmatimonadaceae bacterium]